MADEGMKKKSQADYRVVRGQAWDVMPIALLEHNAEWFDAGPVSFAVEGRVLNETEDGVRIGGGSIHVFDADHDREYVRFDCFDADPHYHYIRHEDGKNVVWGYDHASNGPMHRWALRSIRERLPSLLRSAGADALARRVERDGFDTSVLDRMEHSLSEAQERTMNDAQMLAEGKEWIARYAKETFDS